MTIGSFVIDEVQLVSGYKPFKETKEETVDYKDDTEYGASHCAQSQGTFGTSSIRVNRQGTVDMTYFCRRFQMWSLGLDCTCR